ncbi:MAG: type II secretion system major pseudopilin GspG [bacterium]|nr:type II secretion system major pseudopilin GspG [bacterium]
MKRKKKIKYFTLMEMVVVIAIIALLAAIVTPMYFKHVKRARVTTTRTQISMFGQCVMDYQLDTGKYPQSLQDLITNGSGNKRWDGPYLKANKIPLDPWGNKYVYACPGQHGAYDIYSYGPDGPAGGKSKIIGNWQHQ